MKSKSAVRFSPPCKRFPDNDLWSHRYASPRRTRGDVFLPFKNLPPRKVAERLAEQNIYVWDGNYYAINVTERLGLEENGGMVHVGAVHYNTLEEVEQLKIALLKINAE